MPSPSVLIALAEINLSVAKEKKPFVGVTDEQLIAEAAAKKAKEEAAKDPKAKKTSKPDAALKNFTDKLSELRGTETPKTKKDRLKEAKEFLKEAGVSDVDDIRTSKDFMLMTLGLNIAAGQSGDFLTNVAGGAKETLGTFGELKAKEKDAERAVNLAAAEMAKADYDYEILSEVEQLEMIARIHKFRLLVSQISIKRCRDQDDFTDTVNELYDHIFRDLTIKKEMH